LGVVRVDDQEFVLADLPGLIEGAHEGAGLGDRFLGHAERCGALIHMIDATQDDVGGAYRTIRRELASYSADLARKPEILCLNKCDAIAPDDIKRKRVSLARAAKLKKADGKNAPSPIAAISAATGAGVQDLMRRARDLVLEARARTSENVAPEEGEAAQA
jgi:GTP-binding protein